MDIKYRKSKIQKENENVIKRELNGLYFNLHNKKSKILFSDYTDITISDDTLIIEICTKDLKNPIMDNMQNDGAAFEGWAISLKSWLPKIELVVLKWETPTNCLNDGHYNRFLYRVLKFKEMFDWFRNDIRHDDELKSFEKQCINLKNNSANKYPERPLEIKETRVEYDLVHIPDNNKFMTNWFGINQLNQHLPVGIKKNGYPFFTGGASAIDLWGITNKDELLVIELKYIKDKETSKSKNIKVGIVSELLLYINIMHDIFQNKINKPEGRLKEEIELYKSNIQSIVGCFFANQYHPLLENKDILNILNKNNLNLKFVKYHYEFDSDLNVLKSIK